MKRYVGIGPGPAAAVTPAGSWSEEETTEKVRTMLQLLEDGDGEAATLFEDNEAFWRQTLGDDYGSVADALRSFDFDTALERVRRRGA
jgi:hypothetical protein